MSAADTVVPAAPARLPRSGGSIPLRLTLQIGLILAIGLLWQFVLGPLIGINWVSKPSLIYDRLAEWIANGDLWWHVQATLTAAFFGYVLGGAAALALAFVIGCSPFADNVSRPFITAGYSFPKEAIAPLFIILFGIGLGSKVALASIAVFFIVYQNAIAGVRMVDRDLRNVMLVMGAGPRQLFSLVVAPMAAPWIFAGLRLSVRYAFTAVIFGEMLSGNRGLGYLVKYAANLFDASGVFAALTAVMLVSVTLTLTLKKLESAFNRWRQP